MAKHISVVTTLSRHQLTTWLRRIDLIDIRRYDSMSNRVKRLDVYSGSMYWAISD